MTKGGKENPKYRGQPWKPDRHAQEEMQALISLWDAANFKVQPDKLHRVTKGREEEGYPDTFDDAVRRHAANREMTVNEAYDEVEEYHRPQRSHECWNFYWCKSWSKTHCYPM